jgi:hypothetical protein
LSFTLKSNKLDKVLNKLDNCVVLKIDTAVVFGVAFKRHATKVNANQESESLANADLLTVGLPQPTLSFE